MDNKKQVWYIASIIYLEIFYIPGLSNKRESFFVILLCSLLDLMGDLNQQDP